MATKKIRPLTSVLVKPSGADCNLNCTYCFYLEKCELYPDQEKHRMSEEVLENMVRQAMEQSGRDFSFTWQGGEPTLMGIDFYRKAIELEKQYGRGKHVGNGFQTNGILLNEEWADFLRGNEFLVGLSLDGPAHIHNKYRRDRGNRGTHEHVESVAKMLLERGTQVNAMCCLTDYSSQYAEELYNYYKDMGMTFMQFIPIVEPDKNDPSKAASFSVSAAAYGNFLTKIFDLWIEDFRSGEPTTSIRHFESLFFTYVGLQSPECTLMKTCGPYVVVEHNGDVYSCDFFVEPKWKLGNIKTGKLINMLNSKKQVQFSLAKAQLPIECRKCTWLRHCYGGCTKDRVKDPEDMRSPRFCQSYKMLFAHADKHFREMAVVWKKKQAAYAEYQKAQQSGGIYNAFDDFMKK